MKESALKSIKIAAANVFEVFIWANFRSFGHFILGCALFPIVIAVAAWRAFVHVFVSWTAAATYLASLLVRLTEAF